MSISKYIKWFLSEFFQKIVTISHIKSLVWKIPVHFRLSMYLFCNIPKWPYLVTSTLSWWMKLAVFMNCLLVLEQRTEYRRKTAEWHLGDCSADLRFEAGGVHILLHHPKIFAWNHPSGHLFLGVVWLMSHCEGAKVFIHVYDMSGILI